MRENHRRSANIIAFVSKFDLRCDSSDSITQIAFHVPRFFSFAFPLAILRLSWRVRRAQALFVSNPHNEELLFIYLSKLLYGDALKVIVFDLILRSPTRMRDKVLLPIKKKFLSVIDTFIVIHRDTRGYERYYGVPRARCEYVAFKANNIDLIGTIPEVDRGYVLALGASQRDYELLISAVSGLEYPVKLILSRARADAHNSKLSSGPLPPNVEHIEGDVNRQEWNKCIAESRLVVVPILPDAIQPAGISVYLEAMAFGKPVIVTRGASTEGLLDDGRVAYVIPPGDSAALRAAINQVWCDESVRERLSMNGRSYAMSLGTHERLVRDIKRVIQETCSGRKVPG